VLWTISVGVDEPMTKNIYRTFDYSNNMLHWRESGAIRMSMLCGRGDFLNWNLERWGWNERSEAKYCQECDVKYVLEMMT
jgi:hypothetical protein